MKIRGNIALKFKTKKIIGNTYSIKKSLKRVTVYLTVIIHTCFICVKFYSKYVQLRCKCIFIWLF